jgi:ABC-type transport system involved in cytochrome c biogenesis ATPase subunit
MAAPGDLGVSTLDSGDEISKSDLGVVKALLEGQGTVGATKQIGISFRHLSVGAPNNGTVYVKTLPKAIINTFGIDQFNFIESRLFPNGLFSSAKGDTRKIITDFVGLVKPGEMLFVLGRPGSGCSTFLRTAANRSTLDVTGELAFADIAAPEFGRLHRRETIYLPEEDRHVAALSVSETIRFALRMSLPSKIRNNELIEELVVVMGKMFGLGHVLDTPVGGQFFPGVSGGERKRCVLHLSSNMSR